jgi:hypothetical protein
MKTEVDHAYLSRLSDAAHRKSFDPWRDIDWSVPFDDAHFYLPPDLVSLYGTELWNSMTREQQVRLSMHEASSTLAQGLWFENILSFKLLAYLYRSNPQEPHFYWMLQEIADECRHSMMFGEFIRRSGTPWYQPDWWVTFTANFTRFVAPKVSVFLGVLAAEATTDYLNRRVMQDPECHPIMRQIARIHVIEEARHLGYARHWLEENYARMPLPMRVWIRMQAPIVTSTLLSQLVNARVYDECGLPPQAASMARRNPARRRFRRDACAELIGFLDRIGAVNWRVAPVWRALGMMETAAS